MGEAGKSRAFGHGKCVRKRAPIFSFPGSDRHSCRRAPPRAGLVSKTILLFRLQPRASLCARARAADRARERTAQRSLEYRPARTIHRRCDTADERPVLWLKAHRKVA